MPTLTDRREPFDPKASLAELVASGRATCSVEGAAVILGVGRCTAYEAASSGALPTIRVGRRLLVPVPRLLNLLGIPLPDDWLPAGALGERCQSDVVASDSDDRRIVDHERDADGRAGVTALTTHDSRRHKGSGLRAQASPDRGRGGGRGSPSG
jgi:excisionase family DNA binding protein